MANGRNASRSAKQVKTSISFFQKLRSRMSDLSPLSFAALLAAGIINAFGVTVFLFPVRLYDSGVSGLSMFLDQITPASLTLSIFLLILNLPIFILGCKKQGFAFTVYSAFAIGVYSLMAHLIMNVFPIDVSVISPLAGSDLLLCAVFGGVVSGIGSGLTIRFGGAIDGIDVLAVLFAKKFGLSLGAFVMLFNTALYIVCGIVLKSWVLPLYSIITYYVGSHTVNFIVEGFNRSKCAMIVTTKASEITGEISKAFGSNGTIVNAVGGYSGESKEIIYFVINHFQINKLKQIVHRIDENAFISLQDVSDIIRSPER